ncbi:MAG: glycosyltransferase [Candidatus Bathyarchaeota archaeon]|nr:glycosyltransferase [Candidatus Bathyarchaeota archaeon]
MNSSVSIIIPCKEIDDYVKECVKHCKQLDYGNYEIIMLPDNSLEEVEGVKIIPTGSVTPGAKRNIGIANSNGEICAFIDSDAYPTVNWLSNAIKYFEDPQVAAVGGPGLTPEEDEMMQKASGYVLSSFMVGNLSSRYKAERSFESDDIHSCNFIARKTVLKEVGGWNDKYWPGEDTLICLAMRKLGKKLVEASDVVVYHHRRPLFVPHLKQVSRFGLHRGFFAKRFPENSFRLTYFMPSLLLLSFFAGALASFFNSFFWNILLLTVATYLVLSLIAAVFVVKEAKLLLSVWLGIVATHVVYGLSFLAGLMKRELVR